MSTLIAPNEVGNWVEVTLRSGAKFYGKVVRASVGNEFAVLEEYLHDRGRKVMTKTHDVDMSHAVAVTRFSK